MWYLHSRHKFLTNTTYVEHFELFDFLKNVSIMCHFEDTILLYLPVWAVALLNVFPVIITFEEGNSCWKKFTQSLRFKANEIVGEKWRKTCGVGVRGEIRFEVQTDFKPV